jgi:hypothetical protein
MPGSRKEKRGQVHKRAKDANFGVVETKTNRKAQKAFPPKNVPIHTFPVKKTA